MSSLSVKDELRPGELSVLEANELRIERVLRRRCPLPLTVENYGSTRVVVLALGEDEVGQLKYVRGHLSVGRVRLPSAH